MGGVYQTAFEDSDLSGLPTADPGNGQPWLDASGAIIVGASALDFSTNWGDIGGTLSDQADLADALSAKADSTAVTIALAGKADKATTLAGYGITDAVAIAGAQTITGLKSFSAGITFGAALWKVVDNGSSFDFRDSGNATVASFHASGSGNSYIKGGHLGIGGASSAPSVQLDVATTSGTLAVKNGSGTADAPITASTLSVLANGLTVYKSGASFGGNRAIVLADTGAGGVLYLSSGVRFAPSGVDANLTDVGLYRSSVGVLEINNGTAGTLRDFTCRTITTTGGVAVGPVTYAVLNATTPALGAGEWRVTDRGNRRAYPDGTNWRWVGDDSIIS